MGQKVNPNGLRLGINKDWEAKWYSNKKDFAMNLAKDVKIREFLTENLKNAGIAKVEIERNSKRCEVVIHTSKPGVMIGHGGEEIEKLKTELSKIADENVQISIVDIKKADLNAQLVAESIANQITNRASFRMAQKRAIRNAGTSEFYDIAAKRIIPVETQKYVPRFVASVYIIKNYEKYGLKFKEWKEDYEYYSLPFTSPVRLVAKYSGVTEREFMQLNPALRSPFVPSNRHGYQIRLPKDKMLRLKKNYNVLKNQSAQDYQVYYVKRGDSLSTISYRFGVSQGILMSINGIVNSNRIREGQKLYVPVSYYALQKAKVKTQTAKAAATASHVVARGDTLYGIALKYRTSADTLARLNRLRSPYTIRVGQVLRIR